MQRAGTRARVLRQVFTEWMDRAGGPSAKTDSQEDGVPVRAVSSGQCPCSPPGPAGDLLEEFGFIALKALPPNAAALPPPVDQQVISDLKKKTKTLYGRPFPEVKSAGIPS